MKLKTLLIILLILLVFISCSNPTKPLEEPEDRYCGWVIMVSPNQGEPFVVPVAIPPQQIKMYEDRGWKIATCESLPFLPEENTSET